MILLPRRSGSRQALIVVPKRSASGCDRVISALVERDQAETVAERIGEHRLSAIRHVQCLTFLHRSGKPPVRLIINEATPIPSVHLGPASPTAGALALYPNDPLTLGVWCGGSNLGVVEVIELQPAGKRRMSAAEFLRGHPLQPGDRFGPEKE